MASASYYHPDDNRLSPRFHSSAESFTMRPVHHGYSNLPVQQPMQDSPNPDANASAHEPLHPSKYSPPLGRLKQRKLERLKRYGRVLKFLSEGVSSLFSFAIFALMVYTIVEYATTKDTIREGRSPWPKDAKVWPTIMLLIAAAFTLITSAVILFAYCCCFQRAQGSWKITLAKHAVHTVAWIVIAVVYRYERGLHGENDDLWGWACAEKASPIQDQFNGVINFKSLCTSQSSSWHFSIAEIAVKVVFALGQFVVQRQTHHERRQNLADGLGDALGDALGDTSGDTSAGAAQPAF